MTTDDDRSNGWEGVAQALIAGRSRIGVATVRTWAQALPVGGSILDLGCGTGVPVSEALIDAGFGVYGVDASPSLVAAFRRRFSRAPVACEPVEDSAFFNRQFDGVVAIGLLFLLSGPVQGRVLRRVASALNPTGRFLFTAPEQECTWPDVLTGRTSRSLGAKAYQEILASAGVAVVGSYLDEGDNYYYDATRPTIRDEIDEAV
ncbi:MAG: class I SAM-dependent methyltransferase [Acidobacteria bacterium]|nr:class I SAM-dependent methyltransferase [Acidobacteriota bacterium]